MYRIGGRVVAKYYFGLLVNMTKEQLHDAFICLNRGESLGGHCALIQEHNQHALSAHNP